MAMVEKKGDDDIKEICTTPEKNLKSSVLITNNKRSTMEKDLSSSSICIIDQEELLKSAKAKMGEVREENERLKKLLAQIVMDYKSLEKQISLMDKANLEKETRNNYKDDDGQDRELVSLTLGSWISSKKDNDDDDDDDTNTKKHLSDDWNKRRKIDEGLKLGLDCKFEHNVTVKSENISMNDSKLDCKETKEEENIERWSSNEGLKSRENTNSKEGDEENFHPLPVKKTRVCIRSRCDTPTMNDGCQWRKYGQKIAKGNPCPRAYYRCTVSPTCPVRKQVQRCADDMSILITTYEGTHNHPLPLSATAMASATTAAAAMLKTGPLTSQPHLVGPTTTPTSTSLGLHSSSSPLINNPFSTNPRLSIPLNPSMISASSHSHPTITLDLTTPNTTNISPFHNLLSSSSARNNNNNNNPNSSSFLNFSSTSNSLDFNSRATPLQTSTSWTTNYFNYGTLFPNNTIMNNRNPIYQNPGTTTTNNSNSQQSLNETIAAAATKAIASNPNFQSVLAAAISSYVGTNNNNNDNNNKVSNNPKKSSSPPRNNNAQLMLFPTSLPLPLSPKNSASTSTDSRNHIS